MSGSCLLPVPFPLYLKITQICSDLRIVYTARVPLCAARKRFIQCMSEKQVTETVEAVLACRTRKEAAARLGLSERGLRKRLAHPRVQAALAEASEEAAAQLACRLTRLSELVAATLESLLVNGSERTKAQVALGLLRHYASVWKAREADAEEVIIDDLDPQRPVVLG